MYLRNGLTGGLVGRRLECSRFVDPELEFVTDSAMARMTVVRRSFCLPAQITKPERSVSLESLRKGVLEA